MKLGLYKFLMSVRPELLAALLKKLLLLSRREVPGPNGARYWADPVTLLGLELLSTGTYEPQMTQLIRKLLRPEDTFIDIGANEGYFSIQAALRATSGKVLAIEPQHRLQEVLARNIALNGLSNVDVVACALSDQEGETNLYLRTSINQGASRIDTPHGLFHRTEQVRTRPLEALLREKNVTRARVMKIDCEGAEFRIITGSSRLLGLKPVDYILLEYHPNVLSQAQISLLHQQLRDCGYHLAKWQGQTIYYLEHCRQELGAVNPEIVLDCSL